MNRKIALMNYLKEEGVTGNEIKEGYDPHTFEVWEREYMVLNKQERNGKVKEYIQDTLWAFRPSFLAKVTGFPEKVFHALTSLYEIGNDAILALIEKTCGLTAFVYFAEEEEVTIEGENYFIYRIN
jgi:hypothetical protein